MNPSRIINIFARCALVAGVVVVGVLTVGSAGAIALGAGVSGAVFYPSTKTTRLFRRRPTASETVRTPNDNPSATARRR